MQSPFGVKAAGFSSLEREDGAKRDPGNEIGCFFSHFKRLIDFPQDFDSRVPVALTTS